MRGRHATPVPALLSACAIASLAVASAARAGLEERVTRLVEGHVVDAEGRPVPLSSIIFRYADSPGPLREAGRATADSGGRYRLLLRSISVPGEARRLPPTGALRALLLAPSFKIEERTIPAGDGPTHVDFHVERGAWKTTEVAVCDRRGHPVAEAEVRVLIGDVSWSKSRTDASGRSQFSMAADQPIELRVERAGYRPLAR